MTAEMIEGHEGLPKLDQRINLDTKTPEDFLDRPDVKKFANLPENQLNDFLFTDAKRSEYKKEKDPDAKVLMVLEDMQMLPSSDQKSTEILNGAVELLKQKLGK